MWVWLVLMAWFFVVPAGVVAWLFFAPAGALESARDPHRLALEPSADSS